MTPERLEDLVSDYLDGLLTPEEETELHQVLREDPEARRYLLRASTTHLALSDLSASKREKPRVRTRVRRSGRRTSWSGLWIGVAAAAVVGITVLALRPAAPRPAGRGPELVRETSLPDVPQPPPSPTPPEPLPPLPKEPPLVPAPAPEPLDPAPTLAPPTLPPPLPPLAPTPAPSPVPETRATVASLERAVGTTLRGAAASAGDAVLEGDAIDVGTAGAASFVYPDGTRIELGAGAEARDFDAKAGKRFVLSRGALGARVAKQPADAPLVIGTPQAQVAVMGTTLRLRSGDGETRLEVEEGRVRLTRTSDGRSAEVAAGHFAVASAAAAPVSRPLPRAALTETFESAARVERAWDVTDVGSSATFDRGFTLDLSRAAAAPEWVVGGRTVATRVEFRLPLRVSAVMGVSDLSDSTMALLTFREAGAKMDEPGHLWIERREARFDVRWVDASRKHVKAMLAAVPAAPNRPERWDVELDAQEIRLYVGGSLAGRLKHPLKVRDAYVVGVGGDAKAGAPAGAFVKFFSLRIEESRK